MEDTMEADRRAALGSVFKERDRLIAENERLKDLLERCRDRLDDSDPSDELYCLVNAALAGKGQGK